MAIRGKAFIYKGFGVLLSRDIEEISVGHERKGWTFRNNGIWAICHYLVIIEPLLM
jgi:hypothetical protein